MSEGERGSEQGAEEGGMEGGGQGRMTDRARVQWERSSGSTGVGKPTQRQLRVKDDKNI